MANPQWNAVMLGCGIDLGSILIIHVDRRTFLKKTPLYLIAASLKSVAVDKHDWPHDDIIIQLRHERVVAASSQLPT